MYQRLARRVNETSTLLDQYTALLGQTAHTHKLLSNPNWTGAQDVSCNTIDEKVLTSRTHGQLQQNEKRKKLRDLRKCVEQKKLKEWQKRSRGEKKRPQGPGRLLLLRNQLLVGGVYLLQGAGVREEEASSCPLL